MSNKQSRIKNSKFNIYNLKSKISNLSFLKSEFNRNVLTLTSDELLILNYKGKVIRVLI